MKTKAGIRLRLLVLPALCLQAVAEAGVEVYEPGRVTAIAAVSNTREDPDLPFHSGLFVAYSDGEYGQVGYFQDQVLLPDGTGLEETNLVFPFPHPAKIAQLDGNLVVWDKYESLLIHVDLRGGRQTALASTPRDLDIAEIAISPDGLVLLADAESRRIFWTTLDGGALRILEYPLASRAMAFLAWNRLAILDEDTQSVDVLTLLFDGKAIHVEERSSISLNEMRRSDVGKFRAIAAQDGALYVADETRVFNFVPATGELLQAVGQSEGLVQIEQIQVSRESIYVVDGGLLRKISRSVPVDVVFDTTPRAAQLALLELYAYLAQNSLLPHRQDVADMRFDTLEGYLLARDVFVAPRSAFPETNHRGRLPFFSRAKQSPASLYAEQYLSFFDIFCGRNPDYCTGQTIDDVLDGPVPAGARFELPNLRLKSTLGFREFELSGTSVAEYLDALIVSSELRRRVTDELLARINRGRQPDAGRRQDALLSVRRGTLILPYQTWSVSTSVPAPDAEGRASALGTIRARYPGVDFFSQQIHTKQAGYSHHLPTPPGVLPSEACKALSEKHEAWLERLNYPVTNRHFIASAPRIAVVEQEITKNHLVFEMQPSAPAWYEYDTDEFDLIPRPQPASTVPMMQVVEDAEHYNRQLHHGTHVSGIVGGRRGHCWSGLLPAARLIHIPASSVASIRLGMFNAKNGFVRAVNVSQRLSEDHSYRRMLTEDQDYRHMLFVLAAGNSGVDLNTSDDDSAVQWGAHENVVVVTALDESQQVVPEHTVDGVRQHGANWGSRYVDLAAPGEAVYSASAQNRFGPATGSSQAAPAVAAVAGYLMDQDVGWAKAPGQVKARLIATADWLDGLQGKVWGGILNMRDATAFPDRNVVTTYSDGSDVDIDVGLNLRGRLKIENFPAMLYERTDERSYSENVIPWRRIVSLRSNGTPVSASAGGDAGSDSGIFRVVFTDPDGDVLRIILNAELSGELRCRDARSRIRGQEEWSPHPICDERVNVRQIRTFFQAMTYNVSW